MNGLTPDIIALTGDIIDAPHARIHEEISPLSQLKARLGKYFVAGNHEYFHGVYQWSREMEDLGFTVLCNEHRLIPLGCSELLIGGIPDPRGDSQRADPIAASGKRGDALRYFWHTGPTASIRPSLRDSIFSFSDTPMEARSDSSAFYEAL